MGAKDWLVCYADGDVATALAERPTLDRPATDALVRRLFADYTVQPAADGTLADNANPDDEMVYAGVWPGVAIVCTSQVALDNPSQLDPRFIAEGAGRTVYVHAMHSVVDWFALGVWGPDGELRRALSVSGGNEEIVEDWATTSPSRCPFGPESSPPSRTTRTTTRSRSIRSSSAKLRWTTSSGSCSRATAGCQATPPSIRSTSHSPGPG